jgi:hypothetical protein
MSVSHSKLRPRLAAADNIPVRKGEAVSGTIRWSLYLTMFFVLIDPTVSFLRVNHKLVIAEPCIDKGIDKGAG